MTTGDAPPESIDATARPLSPSAPAAPRAVDELIDRARACRAFSHDFPAAEWWSPRFEGDRLDRALAEEEAGPITLRFTLPAQGTAADLDRLRVELLATSIRVPRLRDRVLSRLELCFASAEECFDTAELVATTRHVFPRTANLPVLAGLRRIPTEAELSRLRSAGCAHLFLHDLDGSSLAASIPDLRALGFTTIAARVAPSELASHEGVLVGEDGLDTIEFTTLTGSDPSTDHDEVGAALIARGTLERRGYRAVHPRTFRRGEVGPQRTRPMDGSSLLGIGPNAVSRAGAIVWRNDPDLATWADAIDDGRRPPGRGTKVSVEDRRRRVILDALLNHGRFEPGVLGRTLEVDLEAAFPTEVAALGAAIGDGLLRENATGLEVTPLGSLFVEVVAACFDPGERGRAHGIGL